MRTRTLALVMLVSTLAACAGRRQGIDAATTTDVPVPDDEPRAQVSLVVDLAARTSCDEAFDLALYAHPGVEHVTWDAARSCRDRHVTVKYLPRRLDRSALLRRVEGLTLSFRLEER